MRLIKNVGADRVLDHLAARAPAGRRMDIASDGISIYAFEALLPILAGVESTRLLLSQPQGGTTSALAGAPVAAPSGGETDPTAGGLLGDACDLERRSALHARGIAADFKAWLERGVDVRAAPARIPQSAWIIESSGPSAEESSHGTAILGDCPATTRGLGLAPGNEFGITQCSESEPERRMFADWFEDIWRSVPSNTAARDDLVARLSRMAAHEAPAAV